MKLALLEGGPRAASVYDWESIMGAWDTEERGVFLAEGGDWGS